MFSTGDICMSQPRRCLHLLFAKALILSLGVATVFTPGSGEEREDPTTVLQYRFPLPLGAEGFLIEPLHRSFFLLASVDDPGLQNLQITRVSLGGTVIAPDGSLLRHYPTETSFRVTASALDPTMLTTDLSPVAHEGDVNSLLLGLRFRLKIYRALHMQVIEPLRVAQIGMPADVPYEERVYRVAFDTSDIPVDARLALEVLLPSGERLSRFHYELL